MALRTLGVVRTSAAFVAAALSVSLVAPADAGSVLLAGGTWEASWDDSLDGDVQIIEDLFVDGVCFIEKAATFRQGPNQFGLIPSISITFRQIAVSSLVNFVINDEIVTNLTGVTWTDFHLDLIDGGDAVFDPDATLASGGGGPVGWSIAPFTTASFALGNTQLNIAGGSVAHGDVWRPGDGDDDGELWIDVVNGQPGDFTVFSLKETPTIPGPATLALLGIGALAGRGRRRS